VPSIAAAVARHLSLRGTASFSLQQPVSSVRRGNDRIDMSTWLEHALVRLGVADAQPWMDLFDAAWRIVLILLIAWLVLALAGRLVMLFKGYMARFDPDPEQAKRVATLARVFRYTASVVVVIVAGMLVLNELGISIAPILATAGVAGVAIGLGAQSLIKDYLSGFFILVENQIRQGDVVEVAGKSGFVEEVTLRHVRLRDYDGNVHWVPNSAIVTVSNFSRSFAFAVMDIEVAYKENLDEFFETLRRVGRDLRADPAVGTKIVEDLELAGVEKFGTSSVVVRCRFKAQPLTQWEVRRAFYKRLKEALDARGVEPPFPQVRLHGTPPSAAPPAMPKPAEQAR
jgi:small-conductance mechanosensitive channel